MNNLGKEHWMVVKWIVRYLRGTTYQALCFGVTNISLHGYFDADMAGDRDNKRNTTGYVFIVGGTTASWVSKLQSVVALSMMEVKYVVSTEASKEMIWLQGFLMNWVRSGNWVGSTVITRVPCILQRTLLFIPRLNIYNSSTISCCQCSKMDN